MFAAALPLPSHCLSGSALATGIRDALVASSFRAHVHKRSSKGQAANQMPADESLAESTTCAATSPNANHSPTGKGQANGRQAPDLELVAVLRSLVLEVLDSDGLPLAGLLSVHYPACAGGRPCVDVADLAELAGTELSPADYVVAILEWAGVPLLMPWRVRKAWGAVGLVDGAIWLTLPELRAVVPFVRGWRGERLRRALRPVAR